MAAIEQEKLVYITLINGQQIIFELADEFAPAHTDRICKLAKRNFWQGAAVYRVQDNYVAQFGFFDFATDSEGKALPHDTRDKLPIETYRNVQDVNFIALPDSDPYADRIGFVSNFPASIKDDQVFALHCIVMVR